MTGVSARTFTDHHGRRWWLAEGLTLLLFGAALGSILLHGPPLWVGAALVASYVCWLLTAGR